MKYEQWLDEWYLHYVAPTVKPKTRERYLSIINKHLKADLGANELSELTPLSPQRYVTRLSASGNLSTGGGLSPNSVNMIISMIGCSLKAARSAGEACAETEIELRRPRVKEKAVTCFTAEEQRKIERAVLGKRSGARRKLVGIVICLYTGLRIGELLALTWSDVDLENGTVEVNKTCFDRGGSGKNRLVYEPKTPSSRRLVPIPKQLLPVLREHKKSSVSPFVIESAKGEPVPVRSYQRSFEILQRNLGIERRGFHSLRHTFATRAIECGMDVKTLSELLGHKNAAVTLNRYAHSLTEHKKEMMDKLGKIFLPNNTPNSILGAPGYEKTPKNAHKNNESVLTHEKIDRILHIDSQIAPKSYKFY